MIRGLLLSASLIFPLCCISPVSAQVGTASRQLEEAKTLWLRRDYPNAYAALLALRAKPYGRRVEVDFMLGTSACQLGYRPYAIKVLTNVMARYPLGVRAQRGVQDQIRNCAPQNAMVFLIERAVPTTSGGWGKTYFWLDKRLPVTSYPARRQRDITPATFSARLIRRGTAASQMRFKAERCSVTVGQFVILCNESPVITPQRQRRIVDEADTFVAFLEARYGIKPSDDYVVMRLVPNVGSVRRLAASLHGLDVSEATIAYSFQDDLSVVAVSSGGSGSVMHELVHLALRRDFGDAPQWLEEGLASLYEVSTACGQTFVGLDNWRGDLLRRRPWQSKPKARETLEQRWFALETAGSGAEENPTTPSMGFEYERAVAEAKMRYISFYLQEQDELASVYAALRNAPPDANLTAHQDTILRKAMGNKYSDLEDTLEWFAWRMRKDAPRALAGGCLSTGTQIRKDIPSPPEQDLP